MPLGNADVFVAAVAPIAGLPGISALCVVVLIQTGQYTLADLLPARA
jgi:hypothetical protein